MVDRDRPVDPIPKLVRVFSALADAPQLGGNSLALWMLVRSMDTAGKGYVLTTITALAEALGKGRSTIKRHLKQGKELGIFRSFTLFRRLGDRQLDGVEIWYAALSKTCFTLGLTDFGAVADVPVAELKHIKFVATELITQQYQQSAQFLEQKHHERPVVQPAALTQSAISGGARGKRKGSRLLVVPRSVSPAGVSQKKVAYENMRSPRTITRRLSNSVRKQKGVDPIVKRQMVQELPQELVALYLSGVTSSLWFAMGQRLYKFWTNLYYFDRELLPQRRQRRDLKRLIAKLKKNACAQNIFKFFSLKNLENQEDQSSCLSLSPL